MQIDIINTEQVDHATGLVVVIDVLRAFTTAAFAFGQEAQDITLVRAIDEAFAVRDTIPNALIMGEDRGRQVAGFDFGNSPEVIARQDLRGRRLVQRTSSGTQGVVRSVNADVVLAGSFVVAAATVRYVRRLAPQQVSLVITDTRPQYGDEDAACADYLAALLRGERPDAAPFLQRVRDSKNGVAFAASDDPNFLPADVDRATELDRFDFAMRANRENGRFVLRSVRMTA